ncbi:MAG: nuclear transport factor 2 family protein [Ginsengibacter sp.]
MDQLNNQQLIEKMFADYASGNMSAVLSLFNKDIVWERQGAPFIPFSGVFKGMDEINRMFAIQATTLSIKEFVPDKICTDDDTVVVLGHDVAEVVTTGKTYSAKWVQAYTFNEGKIIHVQVYMDTKPIADAFLP